MKKFRFQLETVLKVTKMKKEQAEVKFAEATQRLAEQRRQLAVLQEEMRQGEKDYANLTQASHLTVGTLMTYNSFFNWKREQIDMQEEAILHSKAEKQRTLKELMQIMNKLKSIEQLKEKRWQQFKEDMLSEEQKLLDEIGIQLYMRGMKPGEQA